MLDSRRLRVFCEVARRGSFSAAAASLGYTQPAISRQIATLEAEVGTTLVRRVPAGAVLTDAGRLLMARGETILARLDDAETELRSLAGLDGGTLRLATFASAAAAIVPLAVARFRERHPSVKLDIVMADPGDSLPRLRAGELDIVLSHDPMGDPEYEPGGLGSSAAADLELVHLFDDPMFVALGTGHPLAGAETSITARPIRPLNVAAAARNSAETSSKYARPSARTRPARRSAVARTASHPACAAFLGRARRRRRHQNPEWVPRLRRTPRPRGIDPGSVMICVPEEEVAR